MGVDQENRPFIELLIEEAKSLLNKAEQASPDNQHYTYTAYTFHRLAEAWLQRTVPDNLQDYDLGAIAQTAEEHFKKRYPLFEQVPLVYLMANLLGVCLQQALEEEGRKVVFPVLDYGAIPVPDEDELEDYGSGYDPLSLHKFSQRVITKALLRVRGDDYELLRAIFEFNQAQFPEISTREEFIESLADIPAQVRDRRIAEFDNDLSTQSEQTPEIVAMILRQIRERMIHEYTQAIFHGFRMYGDHSIRCGIIATLFLAAQYSNAINADLSGMPEDVIKKELPIFTDLKKKVAAFFADWLIQPLPTRTREGKKAKADQVRTQLRLEYERILEFWREASQICNSTRESTSEIRRSRWREDIRRDFPLLPDDLIERLQPKLLWSDEIKKSMGDKGGSSDPDDIALEHAARLCGADDYMYKLTTLKEYLKQQKRGEILKDESKFR
ncbi:MAG: hypothetical protein HONDAALG_00343 [Gammaproteobacteria bacterium]|nr:hypothetical protein [Gammaproteobacteria bacterium]